MSPPEIAIIGGGIGGLCLAIGLQAHNVPFTLYEATAEFRAVGGGVGLGPNAVEAMRLISPALAEQYMAIATGNASPAAVGIYAVASTEPGLGAAKGWVSQNVGDWRFKRTSAHRRELLDVMVGMLEEKRVRFGKRLVGVQEVEGKVSLEFMDGEVVNVDCVIGCDGCKSRVRPYVVHGPGESAEWSGIVAYRGVLDMATAVEILGGERAENAMLYMGKGIYFMSFPIEKGKKVNVVAFKSPGGTWDSEEWTKEVSREIMKADFEDIDERLKALLSHMEPIRSAIFDYCNTPTYYKSHVCLLGDSAHASTPHQAGGAGQAIEDALVLSRLLAKVTHASDIERCFSVYDEVRRPRAQKVVVTSREAGAIYQWEDKELGDDLTIIVRKLNERFPWIWYYDIEGAVKDSEQKLDLLKKGSR